MDRSTGAECEKLAMKDVIGIFLDERTQHYTIISGFRGGTRTQEPNKTITSSQLLITSKEGSLPSLSSSRVCADRCWSVCRQCNSLQPPGLINCEFGCGLKSEFQAAGTHRDGWKRGWWWGRRMFQPERCSAFREIITDYAHFTPLVTLFLTLQEQEALCLEDPSWRGNSDSDSSLENMQMKA
ncbi:hypothetical protein CDAR_290031 [Caerostris darwini]|uniref:Uncharacterized protein n=1 Tax=Caerostris darwini TaxID=1538125 RepID=A0AAV4WWV5_9ARAC|nr:hypothetical protein CDAR_290031 [Caerostris darwini]